LFCELLSRYENIGKCCPGSQEFPANITRDVCRVSFTGAVSEVLESFVKQWIRNDLESKLIDKCHNDTLQLINHLRSTNL